MLVNDPNTFIKIVREATLAYKEKYQEDVKITLGEDFLIFNLFNEEQTNKIEKELKNIFKKEVKTIPLETVLDIVDDKYQVSPTLKGFVENNEENIYSAFENFILYHKTLLYISWFENNEKLDISLLNKIFDGEELRELKTKRSNFFNALIKEVLLKSKDKSVYSGIQLRVQDANFIYYKFNKENFENYLNETKEKFYTKIDESDVALFWQSKLVTKTNLGIDWKYLNNTVKKIQKDLFRQQMITGSYLMTINLDVENKDNIEYGLGEISNAISNIQLTEKSWRRYIGFLDYTIYQEGKRELLSSIKDFNRNKKRIRKENDNLDAIYESVDKIIQKIESAFEINSLSTMSQRKMSVTLPINDLIYVWGANDKKDIANICYQINRICSIFLFSSLNKNNIIYGLSITETNIDSKDFINIVFNYSEEINEYVLKKLETKFLEFLTEVVKKYKLNYDDNYTEYRDIFIHFMKESDAVILESKMIAHALDSYANTKVSNIKKKI